MRWCRFLARCGALALTLAACGPGRRTDTDGAVEQLDASLSGWLDGLGAAPDRGGVLLPDGAVQVPTPATPTPYERADFSLELPYDGATQYRELVLTATAGRVDVHLLIDTTGSFDGEIDELQSQLMSTVVPGLRARIPSLTLGVSRFEDVPFAPYGAVTDRPFTLLVPQTSAFTQVLTGVARLDQPLGAGGDGPESWAEALYQVATGAGLSSRGQTLVAPWSPRALPDTGPLGGVGWRDQSTRLVVLVTDAPTHNGYPDVAGTHTLAQAREALDARRVRVLGIGSGTGARQALEQVAANAPSEAGRCPTGLNGAARAPTLGRCPLVYDIAPDGTGLSRTVVDAIARLLDTAVFAQSFGDTRDDGRSFVRAIEAVSARPPAGSAMPAREDRRPRERVDGVFDTFANVTANTELRFRVHFANRTVRELEHPQVFYLTVMLFGDETVLHEVRVRVTVPEGPKFDVPRPDATDPTPGSDGGEGLDAALALDASGPDAARDATPGGSDAAAPSDEQAVAPSADANDAGDAREASDAVDAGADAALAADAAVAGDAPDGAAPRDEADE